MTRQASEWIYISFYLHYLTLIFTLLTYVGLLSDFHAPPTPRHSIAASPIANPPEPYKQLAMTQPSQPSQLILFLFSNIP